jgi:hypothetical protein
VVCVQHHPGGINSEAAHPLMLVGSLLVCTHQPDGETEGMVQGVCDGQHQLESLDGDADTAMGLGRETGGAGVSREVATHNWQW